MTFSNVKKVFTGLVILYIAMFFSRMVYDFTVYDSIDTGYTTPVYYSGEILAKTVNNYASLRMDTAPGGAQFVLDQKYERIANIVTKTANYDADMGRFDDALKKYRAVVQIENRRGLAGSRRAEFTIGVRPDNFDEMHATLSGIGKLTSTTTTTNDKTYEYRQMLAERDTLERRMAGYEELRKHGGTIPDLLQLEEKIIEVEAQIQQQKIGLGEYSDENAFCTINYTIYEGTEIGALRRAWNTLVWTTSTYLIIVAVLLFTAFAALLFAWCWSKFKKLLHDKPAPVEPYVPAQPEPYVSEQPESLDQEELDQTELYEQFENDEQ